MAEARSSSSSPEVDSSSSTDESPHGALTGRIGNIRLELKRGLLQKEQVDVIATTSSGNLNLRLGRATRALLEAAGDDIQEECETNYPGGIGQGEVAETGGGNLNCTYIFYCFLRAWDDENIDLVKNMFCDCVKTCLNKVDAYGLQSIAFPAIGTGFLNFPPEEALKLMVRCVKEFSKARPTSSLNKISIVVYPKDTDTFQKICDQFQGKTPRRDSGTSGIPHRKKSDDGRHRREHIQIRNTTVAIVTGSIVEQKADILVNITDPDLKLDRGVLSSAFLKRGGPSLQMECDTFEGGMNFGDIVVTSGHDLPCSCVYHTSLPKYAEQEKDSHTQMLYMSVLQCLVQADETQKRSIAFPCLGCGHHGYPTSVAVATFVAAMAEYCVNNTDTCIREISVVIYIGGSQQWRDVWKTFSKELHALKKRLAIPDSDEKQRPREPRSPGKVKIIHPKKPGSRPSAATPAKSSPSPGTGPPHSRRTDPSPPKEEIKPPPSRGTKEWFQMKYEEEICTPDYWVHHQGGTHLKKLKLSLEVSMKKAYVLKEVDKNTRDAVIMLVNRTWERDKVGAGKDAKGLNQLGFTNIEVTQVLRVENLDLFEKYAIERQRIFAKAWKNGGRLTSIKELRGSKGPVATDKNMHSCLQTELYPEINEQYLFHGTKEDIVEKVLSQGLDNRMTGVNAMFGNGVYAAESSTKADQYVDSQVRRTSSPKKLFLMRMCLGEVYLCRNAEKYRRAPCKECLKDDCAHKKFFDSVLGDGKWIFREFVVYDPRQSYPEFLITYIRK